MISLETLENWLKAPTENEHLEFKEAKKQFDTTKLLKYCVALANEGGGYLIFGVTDKKPRQIVGSKAFQTPEAQNKIKAHIVEKLIDEYRSRNEQLANLMRRLGICEIDLT